MNLRKGWDIEQRTKSWEEWRLEGLGSSDAAVVMGVSPWKTRYELWEEKTGAKKSEISNWAQQRGTQMEPEARANYELLNDMDLPAHLVEHKVYPFMRASLDGYNAEKNFALEIKCPGKKDHEDALNGRVPEKYWPQVQHILAITGGELDYYSYSNKRGVAVRVRPDLEYIKKLIEEETKFWNLVVSRTPPEPDIVEVKDRKMIVLIQEYQRKKLSVELWTKELSKIKQEIRELLTHPQMKYQDVTLSEFERKGAVDYSKIPELSGIDLERYRKDPIKIFEIR
jgi:putative phage-type endonuclease